MKVTVFGAGAIGGHLAFRLARGGADTSVVVRGAHLAAIRERGLTVHAPDVTDTVRITATDDPASLGPQDVVLVTVKAPALPSVAAAIGPLLGPDTAVAFPMNGLPWWYFHGHGGAQDGRRLPLVDPGDAIWTAVGPQRAVGSVVYAASTVTEPGVIHIENPNSRIIFGEPAGANSARVQAIVAGIQAGGMKALAAEDIRREVWAKWLGNITNGPLCIATRQPVSNLFADPDLRPVLRRMTEEAVAVAAGLGRPLEIDIAARQKQSASLNHKPSILQDLELGRPMEIDAQYTAPLALAREAGVPTPTLDLMVAIARQAARAAGLYRG